MHILISPNAFKNSLSAIQVAEAIREGMIESGLKCTCECFPIGDGGDGTGELIIKQLKGINVDSEVHDPLGRIIKSSFGLIDEGKTAVIEMAKASGLRLLSAHELDPLKASSYGTGELINQALAYGVKKIIIALGGSATVDGGCGILEALGIQFLSGDGGPLSTLSGNLLELHSIDSKGVDRRIYDCELIVLCDVNNPLLGSEGAAAVFGPQKGASPGDVEMLEKMLQRFATISFSATGRDVSSLRFGGAAGGTAAGLHAFLNARLVNGIDYFLELTDFDKALLKADVVITGEGSIDEQTLSGKGPFGVARRSKVQSIPVIGLAGMVPLKMSKNLYEYFDVLLSIGHEPFSVDVAIRSSRENLVRTAKQVGRLLAIGQFCNVGRE